MWVLVAVVISICGATDSDVHARMEQEKMRLLEKLGLPERPPALDTARIPQSLIQRLAAGDDDAQEEDDDDDSIGAWMIPALSSPEG